MKRKLLVVLLTAAMLLSLVCIYPSAAERKDVSVELMDVQGGADGIISLTFDDGYYPTALALAPLMEEYGLKASLMLVVDNLKDAPDGQFVNSDRWVEFFENGYFEPQNHSMSHADLGPSNAENQNEDVYKREMVDSKAALKELFPEYDFITYAIPFGSLSYDASEYVKGHYFAIRSASTNGVQTLDPDFSDNLGGWNQIISPSVVNTEIDTEAQWKWIKNCIDINANGWYVPIIHRVAETDGSELSYEMADRMFAYIASLRDEGRVWVTTFSEATKYIRERQNSTVSAYSEDGVIYARVDMASYTEDDMYLSPEIFDTPLTLKVEVPEDYGVIYYTVAGVEYTEIPFEEGGKHYAYINVCPNTTVKLRRDKTHTYGGWEPCNENEHKKVCTDCGYIIYDEHSWDSGEITVPPTHTTEGERLCVCTVCKDEAHFAVDKEPEHTFDRQVKKSKYLVSGATCTEPRIYSYSCECGEAGGKTFTSGEPIGHRFNEWTVKKAATATEDGMKERSCFCGEVESEIIPKTAPDLPPAPDGNTDNIGAEKEGFDITLVLLIAVATTAAAAVACGAVIIVKRKGRHK